MVSFIGIAGILFLALVLLGLLAFLCLPLSMRLQVSRPESASLGTTAATQVDFAVQPFGAAMPWIAIAKGKKTIAGRRKRRAFKAKRTRRADWATMRRATLEMRNLAAHVQIRRVSGSAIIGLNDPSDTGRLMGLLYAAQASLSQQRRSSFRIDFDFSGARFAGDLQMIASLRPIWLLPSALRIARPVTRKV